MIAKFSCYGPQVVSVWIKCSLAHVVNRVGHSMPNQTTNTVKLLANFGETALKPLCLQCLVEMDGTGVFAEEM